MSAVACAGVPARVSPLSPRACRKLSPRRLGFALFGRGGMEPYAVPPQAMFDLAIESESFEMKIEEKTILIE